jgi:hypothetical protein
MINDHSTIFLGFEIYSEQQELFLQALIFHALPRGQNSDLAVNQKSRCDFRHVNFDPQSVLWSVRFGHLTQVTLSRANKYSVSQLSERTTSCFTFRRGLTRFSSGFDCTCLIHLVFTCDARVHYWRSCFHIFHANANTCTQLYVLGRYFIGLVSVASAILIVSDASISEAVLNGIALLFIV